VVHSHVPWSPAFSRPYQTHTRLSERHPVLFVERPVFSSAESPDEIRVRHPLPHLAVAQPVLSAYADAAATVESRVRDALRRSGLLEEVPPAVHWVYRPDLAARLELFAEPLAVVDDCVEDDPECESGDDEADFRRRADVVFTGGHAQFLSRRATHPRVGLIEPAVDFDHFRNGARAPLPIDLERIPAPRAGFAGVLDARLDYELVDRLAAERPALSIVLIGPVDGVPRKRLPSAPNVFLVGPRPYEDRPAYLGGFAVGLLPYRTEGARSLFHPAQVLELLAAGRPVVSTPLPEVARRYGDVVAIAEPEGFAAAVETALGPWPAAGSERAFARARAASWPRVVGEMEILVARAIQDRGRTSRHFDPLERLLPG